MSLLFIVHQTIGFHDNNIIKYPPPPSHTPFLPSPFKDTAGSERYESMSRIYYRGAKAAIVCFGEWVGLIIGDV